MEIATITAPKSPILLGLLRPDGASAPLQDVDLLFNYATLKLHQQDLVGVKRLVDLIVKLRPEMAEHPLVKELADV